MADERQRYERETKYNNRESRRDDERPSRRDDERASRREEERASRREEERATRREEERATRRDDERPRHRVRDDSRHEGRNDRDRHRSSRHHRSRSRERRTDGERVAAQLAPAPSAPAAPAPLVAPVARAAGAPSRQLTPEDFASVTTQFRLWLALPAQGRKLLFDLPKEDARSLFVSSFMPAWNAGMLEARFYGDARALADATETLARTSHAWGFKLSEGEASALDRARDGVTAAAYASSKK